jgi:hypothetical protein
MCKFKKSEKLKDSLLTRTWMTSSKCLDPAQSASCKALAHSVALFHMGMAEKFQIWRAVVTYEIEKMLHNVYKGS